MVKAIIAPLFKPSHVQAAAHDKPFCLIFCMNHKLEDRLCRLAIFTRDKRLLMPFGLHYLQPALSPIRNVIPPVCRRHHAVAIRQVHQANPPLHLFHCQVAPQLKLADVELLEHLPLVLSRS